ncbi:MAG: glyoxalase/bleomycin resistance/extradiol dioxygenase family protein [Hyphomonadaceae bacterium]|nr:glyoxalase/bleomycin resistance/extradiol dioxygenase family protein [Hyphomonadaceae bacterium]
MSTVNERLMQGVIPYLAIDGARDAIAFYRRAFSALMHGDVALMPGTSRVANASLVINGGVLVLSDAFPEMGQPAAKGGHGFTMQLVVDDGDLWWNRAVEAGCEIVTPFARQFWGDRYGQLRDPFGVDWAINEPSAENREIAKNLKLS